MGRSLMLTATAVASADDGGGGKLKLSWPEMVGIEAHGGGDSHQPIIKSHRQDVIFKVLHVGEPQPPDFGDHRVCPFLDDNLIVVRTPVVG